MKNAKKVMSLMLSLAMAASIAPVSIAAESTQTTAEQTCSFLFMEDFEGYDVGTLIEVAEDAEAAGTVNVGNLSLTVRQGDKIEIAKEDNGNKYLRITRANQTTSSTSVRYTFPEKFIGGTKRVSYDFYPEVHSRYFDNFGVLSDGTKTTPEKRIQNMNNYGNTIYLANGVGGNIPTLSTFNLDVSKYDGAFGTISQTVALDGITKTCSVRGANAQTQQEKTGNRNVANAITSINWSVKKHADAAYNGRIKAEDGGDVAGVYRIDNIIVEDVTPLGDTVEKITENFESYPKMDYINGISYANLSVKAGDSMSIATDPETNSKALKIVKGTSEATSSMTWNFGNIEGKTVRISYDVRFQNHSRLLRYFPQVAGANWAFFKDDIYWKQVGSGLYAGSIGTSSDYANVSISFNPNKTENNVTSKVTKSDGTVKESSYTSTATAFGNVYFSFENAVSGGTLNSFVSHKGESVDADTENNPDNNGIYWLDNISVEIVSLELLKTNIANEETGVAYNKNLVLTFNEPVADNAADSIMVAKGDEILTYETDYTVTLSEDKKVVTVSPVGNGWAYETAYSVLISEVAGQDDITPYAGTTINFVTGKFTPYLINDDFSEFTVEQKWVGPQTVTIGENIVVSLTDGDSIEYAYDETVDKNGFKLRKNKDSGTLNFKYIFPETYTNGKYTVKVDERVQNHSTAHSRWPALLGSNSSEYYSQMILYTNGSNWFNNIGDTSKYWMGGYSLGNENEIIGTITTGKEYTYGVRNKTTGATTKSAVQPNEYNELGGVLLRMTTGENPGARSYPGNQVDEDTVNNPNNDGIAWIYGVTVEKAVLDVTSTSFENNMFDFDPAGKFTITFNEALDSQTVTPETVLVYKNGELVTSYEYSARILDDAKTVVVDIAEGLMYGTTYKIVITKDVKAEDANIGDMVSEKTYTINTAAYEDTTNPDIVWCTIPNGKENVDVNTQNIILRTNALLDSNTINTDNIKVYENGAAFSNYTVQPSGQSGISVNFNALKKDSIYRITVSGLKSGGDNALEMTENFETSFTTNSDIYILNTVSKISADGTKSVITAELKNNTDAQINYQVIGVLKDTEGKILSVTKGDSGTLAEDAVADVTVEALVNENAVSYDLYIWDGINSIKPLIKKNTLEAVNERTYGYDNYIDSSKPLNISFIGGSITQQGNYTTPLMKYLSTFLRQDNAERTINYNVQGVGGTGSSLGLYRLEKDVINKNPDIVFIEFAVNDASSSDRTATMEGMIRKLMKLDHQPMIILLDLTTSNHGSLNSINDWEPLMEAYGIGYVNVAQYIIDNEASETNPTGYVWTTAELETYPEATALTGTDGTHPTADGGKIYADYMNEVITANPENFFKKITYVENAVSGVEYANPRMVSWKAAEYDENWKINTGMKWAFGEDQAQATQAGATLTYTFTGTAIGLYVPKSNAATSASYSIDNGAYTGTVSANANLTTEMPMASMIKTGLSEGEHTITITVNSADNLNFKFGYFMVD